MLGRVRRRAIPALALISITACAPELGECDPALARAVAYDPTDGRSAYEGQALMIASCAGGERGGLCHGANADAMSRNGVPAGLEFDVRLASTTSAIEPAEVARLRRGRYLVVQHARGILHTLDLGTMPPPGAGELAAPYLRYEDGAELPAIDSAEGREILRNWLACGAPVAERTSPRSDGVPAVVLPDRYVPPIEPTWASIYRDLLIARRCGNSLCHGNPDAEEVGFHIDPSDCEATHRALVNAEASGKHCGDDPDAGMLVAPGDPDASVLVHKLTPDSPMLCGDAMAALRPEDLTAIREWIEAGAPACTGDSCTCAEELAPSEQSDAGVGPDGGT